MQTPHPASDLLLPPAPASSGELRAAIRAAAAALGRTLVVLDDDPTGTQTVHDVPVLTTWDIKSLEGEFRRRGAAFFILTNSRSLLPADAARLAHELGRNLATAARRAGADFTVVSRGDSTLRGHFPVETDALAAELGEFNLTLLHPYFEAGGRLTLNGVHYVRQGSALVPVAETEFARDAAFGFRSSDLRAYVAEKTRGRIPAERVALVSLAELRAASPIATAHAIAERLRALPDGTVVVADSARPPDAECLALATLLLERAGRRCLYRTAAQFVAARLAIEPRELWRPSPAENSSASGTLFIVGSYVPKTTAQLRSLLAQADDLVAIELDAGLLIDPATAASAIAAAVARAEPALRGGRDVVVFTSRDYVGGSDPAQSLGLGAVVSGGLVDFLRRLAVCPRAIVAKGGITSSDLAAQGLGVRRAVVLGQLLPGVPVWRTGAETKFPGLSYVIFPGNVGAEDALLAARQALRGETIPSFPS